MDSITVQPSPNMRLAIFTAHHVVRRDAVKPDTVRVWLSNGHGVQVTHHSDDSVSVLPVVFLGRMQMISAVVQTDGGPMMGVGTERLLELLEYQNRLPSVLRRDHRLNTLGQLMDRATDSGDPLFSRETMRHTKQTQARTVYPSFGPDGAFFVTGEIVTAGERRKYTVRRAWFEADKVDSTKPQKLRTEIAGEFMEFHRVGAAVSEAASLARQARSKWKFVPDTFG